MKFKFFCMLGTIAVLSSCNNKNDSDVVSQRYVHKYGFDLSESEWIQREKEGQVITTLKNGITKNTSYKNGILHGPTTITFPNTNIIQEKCEYNEGALVKKVIYELSGMPIQETVFEGDGKKIITIWEKNGVPLSMEEYNKDRLISARYYNSQNEIEATVVEGSGTRIKRDRSSLLLSKEKVEDGQIVKRTTFHPNGAVHTQCSFVDYKLNGLEEIFSPSGALISRSNWKMGNLDGIQTLYRNNRVHTEISYVDGKKHGAEKEYDNYGLVSKEINWANDQRHGTTHFTTKEGSDMQWFWRGVPVERKKYQLLKFREELIAQLNGEKPLKPQNVNNLENEQIVLEDEMSINSDEQEKALQNEIISEAQNETPVKNEDNTEKETLQKEGLKSLSEIKAEIQALKALQKGGSQKVVSKKQKPASSKPSDKLIVKKELNSSPKTSPKAKDESITTAPSSVIEKQVSKVEKKVEKTEIKNEQPVNIGSSGKENIKTENVAQAPEKAEIKEAKDEIKQEIANTKLDQKLDTKESPKENPSATK